MIIYLDNGENDTLQLPSIKLQTSKVMHLKRFPFINNLKVFTCLSREVYWFICLNECRRPVNPNHDFSDLFRRERYSLNVDTEVQYRVALD